MELELTFTLVEITERYDGEHEVEESHIILPIGFLHYLSLSVDYEFHILYLIEFKIYFHFQLLPELTQYLSIQLYIAESKTLVLREVKVLNCQVWVEVIHIKSILQEGRELLQVEGRETYDLLT
jgi:hypothetical protein